MSRDWDDTCDSAPADGRCHWCGEPAEHMCADCECDLCGDCILQGRCMGCQLLSEEVVCRPLLDPPTGREVAA